MDRRDQAAAAASAASYRSFADATRSVLDLLERLMPGTRSTSRTSTARSRAPDRRHAGRHRARAALQPRHPARGLLRLAMAEERAPRLCNDLSADPVYAELAMQRRAGAGRYLGVPLELSDGARVGALAALSRAGRPLPARRRAALHDARPRARLRARARVQRARPQAPERHPARPRPRHGRGRPRRPRARRRRGRPPRRLPRRLRDGRRAGLLPARAVRAASSSRPR